MFMIERGVSGLYRPCFAVIAEVSMMTRLVLPTVQDVFAGFFLEKITFLV